ncbi:hypothetical protein EG359_01750 [Chryseobacterium joostei]|uniref:Uncharacterized protein n=1 Tax=Chryseobacterium joostei TaxID=112234 RepID=A0ABN5S6A2_9FLAO|nr:hypothetical protein [Chryseobacterium joostei]AZA98405.1 hypothetical protein EG359_01750 [Chryseobacterium joostei]
MQEELFVFVCPSNIEQKKDTIWLGTLLGGRAETFFRKSGWTDIGSHRKGEIKFEMNHKDWQARINKPN